MLGRQREAIKATTLRLYSLNPVATEALSAEVCFSEAVGVLDSATLSLIPLQTLRTCTEWCLLEAGKKRQQIIIPVLATRFKTITDSELFNIMTPY